MQLEERMVLERMVLERMVLERSIDSLSDFVQQSLSFLKRFLTITLVITNIINIIDRNPFGNYLTD